MPEPKPLRQAIEEFFRRHGVDLDALTDDDEDPDPHGHADHVKAATAYADANIPERYLDAIADDSAVLEWVAQIAERSTYGPAGRFVQKGPSILLLGRTGVGKTYQAYGALRLLANQGVRSRWMGLPAADLYARLRPRHKVDSEAEFRSIADAPLLLVDDLGAAKTSEWVEEVNYRLVNHRYERTLPTIFTSNVPPRELSAELGDRVASRLVEMTGRVTLKGEDRRRVTNS